jgi:carbamoyl-phosphate synthase small subunit
VLAQGIPVFGICLGHQLLALALGAKTFKLDRGHRGANQPVKDLTTGKVEITSQNHGFAVDLDTLPASITPTHLSLFDGSNEGLACSDRPAFSVQYHPEASPGPSDSHHLFHRFVEMMERRP